MRDHVRILGILNIVMGCLVAAVGVVVLLVMGGIAGFVTVSGTAGDSHDGAMAAPILAAIGLAVAIFFLVLALPSIIGGWGLLHYKPWARILMIIVSAFHLLHVPLGTALGVYGLWVLLSDEGGRVFETGPPNYLSQTATYPAPPNPPATSYPPQAPPGV